jgi:hypothetical protein
MIHPIALALGFFGVPCLLMAFGHRLRGRTQTHKRRFWGGVAGFLLGMALAIPAMILPPTMWADEALLRPLLVHWAMLVGGVSGVLTGPWWAKAPSERRLAEGETRDRAVRGLHP